MGEKEHTNDSITLFVVAVESRREDGALKYIKELGVRLSGERPEVTLCNTKGAATYSGLLPPPVPPSANF